jgi:hypothetical protein
MDDEKTRSGALLRCYYAQKLPVKYGFCNIRATFLEEKHLFSVINSTASQDSQPFFKKPILYLCRLQQTT